MDLWQSDDVSREEDDGEETLNLEEKQEVLYEASKCFDASIGINFDTLESCIEEVLDKRKI